MIKKMPRKTGFRFAGKKWSLKIIPTSIVALMVLILVIVGWQGQLVMNANAAAVTVVSAKVTSTSPAKFTIVYSVPVNAIFTNYSNLIIDDTAETSVDSMTGSGTTTHVITFTPDIALTPSSTGVVDIAALADLGSGNTFVGQLTQALTDGQGPTAPTGVTLTPVGGTVIANTLNTTNTHMTATATIVAGQATGGSAQLYVAGVLKLTDATILAGDTTVDFTTSDGTPTNAELQAAIATGGLVYIRVIDAAGNYSTSSAPNPALTVDYILPVINITNPLPTQPVSSSYFITFSGDSLTSSECSIDNVVWVACTSSGNYMSQIPGFTNLPEGASFTLYVRGTELAGNVGTTSSVGAIKDTIAPTAPTGVAVTPVGGTVVANTLNTLNTHMTATATIVAGQATGGSAQLYVAGVLKLTDATILAGDTTVDFTTSDGTPTNAELQASIATGGLVTVQVIDAAGNFSTSAVSNPTLIVDYVAPIVNITLPLAGQRASNTGFILFTDNELAPAQCSIDSVVWVNCTTGGSSRLSNITGFNALPEEASFTFYLRDTDTAGNVGTDSEVGVIKDTIAPAPPTGVTITPIGGTVVANTLNTTNTNVRFSATIVAGPNGKAEFYVAGSFKCAQYGLLASATTVGCTNADNTTAKLQASIPLGGVVYVKLTDSAGNISTISVSNPTLIVDYIVPTTPTIDVVAGDDVIDVAERTATVTVTGTNESGATVTLDGNIATADTLTTWSYVLDAAAIYAFDKGPETLTAVATDTAGNPSANGTRAISVDASAPGPTPTAPTGVTVTPVGGTVVANTLNTLNTHMTATATIVAGEATGGSAKLYVAGVLKSTDATILAEDTTVDFTTSDGTPTNAELQAAIATGGLVTVQVINVDGNFSTSSVANPTLIVDYVGPNVNITFPLAARVVSGNNRIMFTQDPSATFECSIDNVVWVTCTSTVTKLSEITGFTNLPEGAFTLYLRGTDTAGNVGTDSEVGIIKDTTPPAAPTVVTITPVGGTVVANTLNTTNTYMTITATIVAGQAIGGRASFYKTTSSLSLLGDDTIILASDTTVDFTTSDGTPTNAELRAKIATGGLVTVSVTDAAGNTSTSAVANPTLIVDYIVPTTPIINMVATDDVINAAERTATVTVTGTKESGSTVTLNGNLTTSDTLTTWSYVLDAAAIDVFGQGAETLIAVATDTAGNPSANGTRGISVDTVVPTTPVIDMVASDDLINDVERTGTVMVTGTKELGSTVTLNGNLVSADTFTAWSYVLDATAIDAFGQGAETLAVVATDTAGNPSANGTRAISVDTVVPTFTAVRTASNTIVLTFSENVDSTTTDGSGYSVAGATVTANTDPAGASTSMTLTTTGLTVTDGTPAVTYTQAAGTTVDAAGNEVADLFSANAADQVVPNVTTYIPADGAIGIVVASDLMMTFDENVRVGTGNVVIYSTSTGLPIETIDITSGLVIFNGTTGVTINPSASLLNSVAYNVQIDSGAILDTVGNAYAGIADTTTWNFTTAAAPSSGSKGGIPYNPGSTNELVSINSDATETLSTAVTLTIVASYAAQMIVSNNADFFDASWESMSATKSWTLSDGFGTKTVYVNFRDNAGNTGTVVSDTINYVQTAPTPTPTEPVVTPPPPITQPAGLALQDPTPAAPLPPQVSVGMLVKLANMSSIYFIDNDNRRHVFPNLMTYYSWFSDFSLVQTISADLISQIPLGRNVTMRPGTYFVKLQTDPKVYAVESYGLLRWIPSETVAISLFGSNWVSRVANISDAFFTNYQVGLPLTPTTYPEGSLIQYQGDSRVYIIENGMKEYVSFDVFVKNYFQNKFKLVIGPNITYPDGPEMPVTPIETLMKLR